MSTKIFPICIVYLLVHERWSVCPVRLSRPGPFLVRREAGGHRRTMLRGAPPHRLQRAHPAVRNAKSINENPTAEGCCTLPRAPVRTVFLRYAIPLDLPQLRLDESVAKPASHSGTLALELITFGVPGVLVGGENAPPEVEWRKNLVLLTYLALSPDQTRSSTRRQKRRRRRCGICFSAAQRGRGGRVLTTPPPMGSSPPLSP